MSDLPTLPIPVDAERIPAALAAPKGKRKVKPASVEPFVAAPATWPDETPASADPIAAAPAHTPIEEPTMATNPETVTQTTVTKAQAMFGEMNERAKGAMERGATLVAEMNDFAKGNVEALVESGRIAVAGLQTMAQDNAASVRKHFEDATAQARTLATAKSPTELMKLHGDFVRQQFDAMVAETSRSTEAALKLAGEVAQPISNRFALAAEKVRHAA
jgi:phasin family protein